MQEVKQHITLPRSKYSQQPNQKMLLLILKEENIPLVTTKTSGFLA